jgi:hypothetical protein
MRTQFVIPTPAGQIIQYSDIVAALREVQCGWPPKIAIAAEDENAHAGLLVFESSGQE